VWQRACTVIGGVLLVTGLLGALRATHQEAMVVSARVAYGQWGKHKGSGADRQERRWSGREDLAFDLSLAATAIGVALQTFAAAFPE
jgi:hypothetical protein